jgi:glucose/arabinose dehydrogenase
MEGLPIARGVRIAAFAMFMLVLVTLLATAQPGSAKPPKTGNGNGHVGLKQIGDFDEPVYTETAPGKANKKLLFVVERGGVVRVMRGKNTLNKPFIDVTGNTKLDFNGTPFNERGLLSIAFDPGYAKNRRFYLYYTAAPDGDVTVAQFKRKKNSKVVADPSTAKQIISIPHSTYPNHNGGQVTFGPDGNMWLATGDGGFACDPNENAQNLDSLLGKLLRIAPKASGGYSVPKDNPFVGSAGADEIYSYGLRNPFRFSFDKSTKTIAIGDVGQDAWEEVDYLKTAKAAGANFGWDAYEGDDPLVLPSFCESTGDTPTPLPDGSTFPILTYPHSSADPDQYTGCAIIGGPVVRNEKLKSLYGRYLYSDSCDGGIQSLVPGTGGATGDKPLGRSLEGPSSITEVRKHRVYATSLSGPVYKLVPTSGPEPTSSGSGGDSATEGGSRTGDGGGSFPSQAPR